MNSALIGKNSNQEKEVMYRKHLTGNVQRVSCIQRQGTQSKGMGKEDFLENEK